MLSREQHQILTEQGALHLPAFFSPAESQRLVEEAQVIMSQPALMSPRDESFYARYGADNATFVNQHAHGALLGSLVEGPRLASLASSLFPQGAAFHMSLVQLSEPGRRQGISWHQDVDPSQHEGALYNFLIYPEDLTLESGPLVYVPGSHRAGRLPPGDHYGALPGQRELVARAGDLAIVHGTLFHCVPRNQTGRRRFSINLRFRDARVRADQMTVGVYRNGKFDYGKGAPVQDPASGRNGAAGPAGAPAASVADTLPAAPQSGAMARLLERERALLTTGMTPGFLAAPRVFSHGRGVRLYDVEGAEYFDFSAGTFTNATGHCHPRVVSFMQERVADLWNIHDYASPYRASLLQQLDELTPPQIDTFEFYSGGTETIEAGLRALSSVLPEGRKGLCTFKQGYHGKTLGSRSLVGWAMPGEQLSPHPMLDFPNCYRCPFGKAPASCDKGVRGAARANRRREPRSWRRGDRAHPGRWRRDQPARGLPGALAGALSRARGAAVRRRDLRGVWPHRARLWHAALRPHAGPHGLRQGHGLRLSGDGAGRAARADDPAAVW